MSIQKWLVSVALKKALKELGKVAIAGLVIAKPALAQVGIDISWDEAVVIASVAGGVEILRNFLKHKVGIKWL